MVINMKCFLKCAGVWLAVVFGFMVFAIILIAIPYVIESFWEMFFDKQSFAFALACFFTFFGSLSAIPILIFRKEICK